MARLIGPLHSLRAVGQFAKSIIFKQKGNRNIATNYNFPGSVKTFTPNAAQNQNRTLYGSGVEAWSNLTTNEKEVYNERAKYKSYSGWNLFLKEFFADTLSSQYGVRVYGIFTYGKSI